MLESRPISSSPAPAGLHVVRNLYGGCFVLVDEHRRAVVLDTGLVGERIAFRRLFARLGLAPDAVEAILLTHGHIDHTGNLAWLRDWTGAPVYAHPDEQAHIDGRYPYRGIARVCGGLEAFARLVLRYRPVPIERPIADGDELPFWGGLRVVHLPGHTLGHCGFWSDRHRLLFAGDLVAIWSWRTALPPPIFNSAPQLLRASLSKAAALEPQLVVPNHFNRFDPAWMAGRLAAFARRHAGPSSSTS